MRLPASDLSDKVAWLDYPGGSMQGSLPAQHEKPSGFGEFILLMAMAMSLVALSIDMMLPAFPVMGRDLGVSHANDIQLVISWMFIGLALGQPFYGPLSDSIGRKPAMHAGFAFLLLGSVVSMTAGDFSTMLLGRFLQGFGAAGPRTVALALIRDRFHGEEMARVMSFIMTIFILVPVLAPALGQGILLFADWPAIFLFIIAFGLTVQGWLTLRQPETLAPEYRRPFTLKGIGTGLLEVLRNGPAMVYTVVAGCMFGAFMGYLNSCQAVFQQQYGLGKLFPLFFGGLAFSAGISAIINGNLVMRFGMRRLTHSALYVITALSWFLFLLSVMQAGEPPLWQFMAACVAWFFCIGVVFGNINALAMEQLGHVAGSAAAVIGTATTLMAVGLGFIVGRAYDGTVLPLSLGFAVLASASVLLVVALQVRDRR
jgi:DHA1 family bicyclomycin/chloramphenicol resistance-like MFS transporter